MVTENESRIQTTQTKQIEREWHALKGGDIIRFAGNWYEIFDAYPSGYNMVTIKLIVNQNIKTYRIRTHDKATCLA